MPPYVSKGTFVAVDLGGSVSKLTFGCKYGPLCRSGVRLINAAMGKVENLFKAERHEYLAKIPTYNVVKANAMQSALALGVRDFRCGAGVSRTANMDGRC